jgi:P-type E1-E2 ATPase
MTADGAAVDGALAMVTIDIPFSETLELDHLVLDVNGTITARGELIEGVQERLARLRELLDVMLLTSDTRGTATGTANRLGVTVRIATSGLEKEDVVRTLGPERTVAIGNGRNDEAMLRVAALGIAVIGPEGAATSVVRVADVVCSSITEALDLVLDPATLVSTLRP